MSWVLRWDDLNEPFGSQGLDPYFCFEMILVFRKHNLKIQILQEISEQNDGSFEIGNFWINFCSTNVIEVSRHRKACKGKLVFLDSFFGAQLLDMTHRKHNKKHRACYLR